MNKFILISIILTLTTGCAKSSDVEALAKRVTNLEEKVSVLEKDVATVKIAATEAAARATAAETAANRAATIAEETNSKINKIFKQNCAEGC